ncbi:MAG: polysaccharide deacetylase family protein [Caulobacterales bacterium]|nr:polysaccharide deacetylase family protein [Caulobacterales bacterium]
MSAPTSDPAPEGFAWPNGAKLALSIVVNVEEGAENNIRDGDRGPEPVDELGVTLKKPIRIHGNESNYQYGINRGAPRVLALLDRYGVPATWTACSQALERAPWLAEAIAARGDEPCCHGWRWAFTAFMSEAEERDFIRKGTESIVRTCGRPPAGWLSRYLHTDATRRLLVEEGYRYHMDDYSDDFPYWDVVETAGGRKPMVILPYAIDSNDMKFWLSPSFTTQDWLRYAKDTFDWLYAEAQEEGARMMSLGLHLRIIGRPGRIGAFADFLDYVTSSKDGVWIATREQIADHFTAQVPPPAA